LQRIGKIVIFYDMSFPSPPPVLPADGSELVRRLGLILAGLGAVVARRFLRDPRYFALIVPLFCWFNRSAQRFARAVARPKVIRPAVVVRATRPALDRVRATRVRLPSGRAWLLHALGWEVAGYGSQLETLLAEPAMVALLAEVPAVGRIIRPLRRMLGMAPKPVRAARVPAETPKRVRVRVARVEAWEPGRAALREAAALRRAGVKNRW